jgi:hypothetical protein
LTPANYSKPPPALPWVCSSFSSSKTARAPTKNNGGCTSLCPFRRLAEILAQGILSLCDTALIKLSLAASGEPPIHELQHLHWNFLLVKILAFEPATNRKFFGNTIDALIFESDDNGVLAVRLVPNNISDFKIGVH